MLAFVLGMLTLLPLRGGADDLVVTNTADAGLGSLRWAITNLNSLPPPSNGLHVILFDIPPTNSIAPTNRPRLLVTNTLPAITNRVRIDGCNLFTNAPSGFSSTEANGGATQDCKVIIDGTYAGTNANGLTIRASGCTVETLELHNFSGYGLLLENCTGTAVRAACMSSNGLGGILLDNVSWTFIGTTNENELVRLFNNGGNGCTLLSGNSNSFHALCGDNGGLGFDLLGDGVTPNDTGDADTGPNNLQNFAQLNAAYKRGTNTVVKGSFLGLPNTRYVSDFYHSATADPTGFGEGEQFLGIAVDVSDSSGRVIINEEFQTDVPEGNVVTATTTCDLNTSEFSKAVPVGGTNSANLGVQMVGNTNRVRQGEQIICTNFVTNFGPIPATDVEVFFLPPCVEIDWVTTSQGTCVITNEQVNCNLGTLAEDATAVVVVATSPTNLGTIHNTVSVTAKETDPDLSNNTDAKDVDAIPPAGAFPFCITETVFNGTGVQQTGFSGSFRGNVVEGMMADAFFADSQGIPTTNRFGDYSAIYINTNDSTLWIFHETTSPAQPGDYVNFQWMLAPLDAGLSLIQQVWGEDLSSNGVPTHAVSLRDTNDPGNVTFDIWRVVDGPQELSLSLRWFEQPFQTGELHLGNSAYTSAPTIVLGTHNLSSTNPWIILTVAQSNMPWAPLPTVVLETTTTPADNNNSTITLEQFILSLPPEDTDCFTNCPGETVFATVNPAGPGATNQWYKDGYPLPGETNSTLVLSNLTFADEGIYIGISEIATNGTCKRKFTKYYVQDTVPPFVICSSNITTECTSPSGTPVFFGVSVGDTCGQVVTNWCDPPSGFPFPPGSTTVTCSAIDTGGNLTVCTFSVTVIDTTPPQLTCSDAVFTVDQAIIFHYNIPVSDNCDSNPVVVCDPPSGSTFFPNTTTLVMCTATDASGNSNSCSFNVTLQSPGPPAGVVNETVELGFQLPVGDPVSGFSGGHFMTEAPDLNLGGPGAPIFFQRHYDSKLLDDGAVNSALGPNWQHNYDLTLSTNGTNATVVFREGRIIRFGHDGTNWNLTGRADIPFRLVETGTEFLLADPRSQFMYFFTTNGQLARIEDGRGNTNRLSYSGTLLTNVTDGLNRNLDFAYDAGGFLTNVTDRFRSVSFAHSGSNLTSLVDALGQTTTYAYDPANTNNPALMTARTLPEGNTPLSSAYDVQGRVIAQTDAVGNAVAMSYFTNAGNRINIFTNAISDTQVQTYNPNGELSQFTDEAGSSINMTSDAAGRRNSVTDRLGHTTQITYDDANGFPVQIDLPSNPDEFMAYSARSVNGINFFDLTQAAHPDSTTNQFAYDAQGNLIFSTNRNGDVWFHGYNNRGQLLSTTNPLGGVTTLTYDANARLASSTDSDIGVTTFDYDPLNRLTNITHPNPDTVQFAYDALNRLISVTDERGNTTTFQYDANSRLTNVVDALGQSSRFAYDALNRLTRTVDRLGAATTFGYDPRSLLSSVTNRNGFVTQVEYDERQRLTAVVNAGGATNAVGYDAEGRMTAVVNPLGETFSFQRDPMGYVTNLTDPLGNQTALLRDAMKRVTRLTDPLGRKTTFAYEARGLLTNVTRELGISARYGYNPLGLPTNITDPILSEWTFNYSAMGRQTNFTDPLGRATRHEYDVRGRLSRVTFADGTTLTNTYDGANNLIQSSYSDGTVFHLAYDALNRLTNAATSDPVELGYDAMDRIANTRQVGLDFGAAYDADGRLTNVTYNSGQMVVSYVYNSRDQLVHVRDNLTGQGMGFNYDEADRLTGITRSNGVNTTYTYDGGGRLTRIQDSGSSNIIDIQYTLDPAGRVKRVHYVTAPIDPTTVMTNESVSLTYDAASQINTADYQYDPQGRLTNAPNTAFRWDAASRLTGIDAVNLAYNAFGDIVTRVGGGVTNRYFYNHALRGLPIVAERDDSSGQFARFYIWSPEGRLLYLVNLPGNTVSYPHFDYTRSTLALTDGAGAVTDAYAYDPYGRIVSHSGSDAQPFRFVGEYGVRHEPAGNLHQMRARYYDPQTARFLSKEPIWPALGNPLKLNPYQYAQRDPVNLVDRDGTEDDPARPTWYVGYRVFEMTAGPRVESYYLSPELQTQANEIYDHLKFSRFTNMGRPFSAKDARKLEEEILDLFRLTYAGDLGLIHPLTMRYLVKPSAEEREQAEKLIGKLLKQAEELRSFREDELRKRQATQPGDEQGFLFDGESGSVPVSFDFGFGQQSGGTDKDSLLFTGSYSTLLEQTSDRSSIVVAPGLSGRVPQSVIDAALKNPGAIQGFGPGSRELSLRSPQQPYHPLFNPLSFR